MLDSNLTNEKDERDLAVSKTVYGRKKMKQVIGLSLALLAFLATIGLTLQAEARRELRILEMSISPSTPTQGKPARISVRIASHSLKKAKSFRVM